MKIKAFGKLDLKCPSFVPDILSYKLPAQNDTLNNSMQRTVEEL